MVISMSQPWKHPETGVWYFRGRIPAKLKDQLAGQKLTIRVAGSDRLVVVRDIIKVTLGTKETGEAKLVTRPFKPSSRSGGLPLGSLL